MAVETHLLLVGEGVFRVENPVVGTVSCDVVLTGGLSQFVTTMVSLGTAIGPEYAGTMTAVSEPNTAKVVVTRSDTLGTLTVESEPTSILPPKTVYTAVPPTTTLSGMSVVVVESLVEEPSTPWSSSGPITAPVGHDSAVIEVVVAVTEQPLTTDVLVVVHADAPEAEHETQ